MINYSRVSNCFKSNLYTCFLNLELLAKASAYLQCSQVGVALAFTYHNCCYYCLNLWFYIVFRLLNAIKKIRFYVYEHPSVTDMRLVIWALPKSNFVEHTAFLNTFCIIYWKLASFIKKYNRILFNCGDSGTAFMHS